MKEHPIIFSTDMVKAILVGHKTQIRRVIKPQPSMNIHVKKRIKKDTLFALATMGDLIYREEALKSCPFGQPGDRLWVRETWQLLIAQAVGWGPGTDDWDWEAEESEYIPKEKPELGGTLIYKVDDPDMARWWRPSIHMPRWASRIDLEITNIKVERLQEITEADAQREGWFFQNMDPSQTYDPVTMDYARRWFMDLWNRLNAKRGYPWESNPWVWVIEFRKLETVNNARICRS